MFSITHYQRNANPNHNEVSSHTSQNGCHQSLQTDAGEGVEKREPSYTDGGNANQYSCYGEQCGDLLKNWKQNCHMTQQSRFWAYTLRKPLFLFYEYNIFSQIFECINYHLTNTPFGLCIVLSSVFSFGLRHSYQKLFKVSDSHWLSIHI